MIKIGDVDTIDIKRGATITERALDEVVGNGVNLSASNGYSVNVTVDLGSLTTVSPVKVFITAETLDADASVAITIRSLVVNRVNSNTLRDFSGGGADVVRARKSGAVHANTPTATSISVEGGSTRGSTTGSLRDLTTIMGVQVAIVESSNAIKSTSSIIIGELVAIVSIRLARTTTNDNVASFGDGSIAEHQAIERSEGGDILGSGIVRVIVVQVERGTNDVKILVEEREVERGSSSGLTLTSSGRERTSASTDTSGSLTTISRVTVAIRPAGVANESARTTSGSSGTSPSVNVALRKSRDLNAINTIRENSLTTIRLILVAIIESSITMDSLVREIANIGGIRGDTSGSSSIRTIVTVVVASTASKRDLNVGRASSIESIRGANGETSVASGNLALESTSIVAASNSVNINSKGGVAVIAASTTIGIQRNVGLATKFGKRNTTFLAIGSGETVTEVSRASPNTTVSTASGGTRCMGDGSIKRTLANRVGTVVARAAVIDAVNRGLATIATVAITVLEPGGTLVVVASAKIGGGELSASGVNNMHLSSIANNTASTAVGDVGSKVNVTSKKNILGTVAEAGIAGKANASIHRVNKTATLTSSSVGDGVAINTASTAELNSASNIGLTTVTIRTSSNILVAIGKTGNASSNTITILAKGALDVKSRVVTALVAATASLNSENSSGTSIITRAILVIGITFIDTSAIDASTRSSSVNTTVARHATSTTVRLGIGGSLTTENVSATVGKTCSTVLSERASSTVGVASSSSIGVVSGVITVNVATTALIIRDDLSFTSRSSSIAISIASGTCIRARKVTLTIGATNTGTSIVFSSAINEVATGTTAFRGLLIQTTSITITANPAGGTSIGGRVVAFAINTGGTRASITASSGTINAAAAASSNGNTTISNVG